MIEVNIVLDPVASGIEIGPEKTEIKEGLCLVVGTNGDYKLVNENEAADLLDRLGKDGVIDFIKNTPYALVYSKKNVISINGTKVLIGSALIIKDEKDPLLYDKADIDKAKLQFLSRLVRIKLGSDKCVTAYEIC